MRTNGIIVGIGEILWDKFPDGDRLGGAPANFAFHAAGLGENARIVSRIGKDADGEKLLALVESQGAVREFIQQDAHYPTGRVRVDLTAGHPTYTIESPAAWDCLELTDALRELARNTSAVCFNTLAQRHETSRACIQHFVQSCPPATLRLFDINLRQSFYSRKTVEFGLRHADILKLNVEERDQVARMFHWRTEDVVHLLLEIFPLKFVALTRGAEGCTLYTRTEKFQAPAPEITLVDAVGAGDAFSAALVSSLLNRKPPFEAVHFANRVGAYVASRPGATPALPPELLST